MPAATKKSKDDTAPSVIELQRLTDATIAIPIAGITPYIPHRYSKKARRQMPGHPDAPKTKTRGEALVPVEEADAVTYRLPDGRAGVPAGAFKAGMALAATKFFSKIFGSDIKVMVHIVEDGFDVEDGTPLVAIEGRPVLREDLPRNSDINRTPSLRYRYAFHEWTAVVRVQYLEALMTRSSVISLLDAAGRAGVGDWRPSAPKSATGDFGRYRVDDEREVEAS